MITSEDIANRYKKIERESDALGRVIGVRKLRLSQQIRVDDLAPANDRHDIPLLAASVCEIDGIPIPFPNSRGELDAIIDRLDGEGMAAARIAWQKLFGAKDATESDADRAKK